MTIVFVTHDVDEAILLSDRVLVMSRRPGRIRADFEVPLPRPRRRPPDFAPSSETPGGYVGQAVLESGHAE
jgi:NitT/TauT family transport system ATP-binding protein